MGNFGPGKGGTVGRLDLYFSKPEYGYNGYPTKEELILEQNYTHLGFLAAPTGTYSIWFYPGFSLDMHVEDIVSDEIVKVGYVELHISGSGEIDRYSIMIDTVKKEVNLVKEDLSSLSLLEIRKSY